MILIFGLLILVCIIVGVVWKNWDSVIWRFRGYIDPTTGKDLRELGLLLFRVESEFGDYRIGDVIIVDPLNIDLKIGDIVYVTLPGYNPFWIIRSIDLINRKLTLGNNESILTQFPIGHIRGKVIGKENLRL